MYNLHLLLVKLYWIMVTGVGIYYGAMYLRDVLRARTKLTMSGENGALRLWNTIHLRTSILSALGVFFLFLVGLLSLVNPSTHTATVGMIIAALIYAGAVTVVVGNMALSRRDRSILDASIRKDISNEARKG